MGLRQTCLQHSLVEVEPGFIFAPFGPSGKAWIISKSSSSSIVSGMNLFCVTIWPVIAALLAAGIYARVADRLWPFFVTVIIGIAWVASFAVWAKLVTRGHVEYPRHAR